MLSSKNFVTVVMRTLLWGKLVVVGRHARAIRAMPIVAADRVLASFGPSWLSAPSRRRRRSLARPGGRALRAAH